MEEPINKTQSVPFSSPKIGRIFITGGTGFIGAYIIKNLVEKGFAVRAMKRSASLPFFIPAAILEKVEWVEGEILDVVSLHDAMQDVDAVIHSAAMVSFSRSSRSRMYKVNIEGTANVVNAALDNAIGRFLHISSVAALGRTTGEEVVSEESKWQDNRNNTHYAISKRQAEMHVWRGFAEGLKGVIINPGTVLGFGDWHRSSCAIFKKVYRGIPWYTKGINGFVGVEDVAEAAAELLLSAIERKRLIVNAENITFQHLLNLIAQGFGKKPPDREATRAMGAMAWRLESLKSFLTGQQPLLTRETAKVAHSLTSFDNGALLKALPGFQYTPLETVIRNSCEKYIQAMRNVEISL